MLKIHQNLGEFLKHIYDTYPTSVALETKKLFRLERHTYKDLGDNSRQVAAFLRSLGVQKGDRVFIWAPNLPEWVVVYFGSLFLGAVVVPVDPNTSSETISKFVKSTSPKIIFRSKFLGGNLNGLVEKEIFLEELDEVLAKFEPLAWKDNKIRFYDVAEIVFTSGTTSEPKGVILTHKNLLANLKSLLQMFPGKNYYRFLSILPLSHMYEQMVGLLGPLSVGARITYLPRLNSLTVAKTVRESGITAFIAVPQVLNLLLNSIERKVKEVHFGWWWNFALIISPTLPFMWIRRLLFHPIHRFFGGRLEFIAVGGAPLNYSLARTWELLGVKILQGYGTTEASPLISMNTLEKRRLDSVGKLVPGVEVKIEPNGEITVRGENITQGYWQNEEATKKSFADGWYRTGDIGYLDDEDFLYIQGREKFMIVLPDGMNVYPEDIEKKLNNHPAIKDSTIVGLKKEGEESVHAVLILKKRLDPNPIVREINKKLESHQQITSFGIWPEEDFPRTHTLKINRKEVLNRTSSGLKQVKPTTDEDTTSDKLVEIVATLSNKDHSEITPGKNLVSDLGFDSLSRLELVALIEEEMGVSISESSIDSNTTIGKLKQLFSEAEGSSKVVRFKKWPLWTTTKIIRLLLQNILLFPFTSIFTSLKVKNRDLLTKMNGPAIFIFNHTSHFDAPTILEILPSKIRRNTTVAASQDYFFTNPFLGNFVKLLVNAFPFARKEPIRPSLEHMGELLDLGHSVVIAPEGTRSPDGKLAPFKAGAGMMAVEMMVPVVPVKLQGLFEVLPKGRALPRFRKVTAMVGKPIAFDKKTSYLEATRILHNSLKMLS